MLSRALACLLALSCAHEAPEPAAPKPARAPASLPFPEGAFRNDDGRGTSQAPTPASGPPAAASPSRFETRRIGAEPPPLPRHHGAPVDLDLKSADLANVFRLLADVGHVNIVVAGDVTGTITLRLKHVPWDQALELVARTRDLVLEQDGNVIVVRTARRQ